MSITAQAAGYLVIVAGRDGICLYSPNLEALIDRYPWDLCWEEEGKAMLRNAFIEACMFRNRQERIPASLRIDDREFEFEAWLDPTGSDLVICRMVRIFTSQLSQREKDVLSLVAGGASNTQIAKMLGMQESTVRSHLKKMREKLGVVRPEGLLLAAAGLANPTQDGRGCDHGPRFAELNAN